MGKYKGFIVISFLFTSVNNDWSFHSLTSKFVLNRIHHDEASGEEEVVPTATSSGPQGNPDAKGTSGRGVGQR